VAAVVLDGVERRRRGAPPPPVAGQDGGHAPVVDLAVQEEGDHVLEVAVGPLDDLQLGQQEVRRVDRRPRGGEPVPEHQGVAHDQPVDEDVDLPAGRVVQEDEALVAVQRVEVAVGTQPVHAQRLLDPRPLAAPAHEVEVLPHPVERRPARGGAEEADGGAADRAQGGALRLRVTDQGEGVDGQLGKGALVRAHARQS